MIESISIKGYQSHVNSTFQLSPGLTVITGPTDSGKTAIIRAIRWVIFGEPSGESFVNESVGEATVQIKLSNEIIITKNRHKGKTSYGITYPDADIKLFAGTAIPEEIITALGITKQSFGDFETTLNFAYQLEAPFLISEPASTGAKVLGKIAGTEVVDLAVKAVAKDTYAARQEITQANKDIERIEADLLEFADLEQIKEQLDSCEFLLSQYGEMAGRLGKLQSYQDSWTKIDTAIQIQIALLEKLGMVPELQSRLQDTETRYQQLQLFIQLYESHKVQIQIITDKTAELLKLQHIDQLGEDLSLIEQASQRINVLTRLCDQRRQVLLQVANTERVLTKTANIDVAAEQIAVLDIRIEKIRQLKSLSTKYQQIAMHISERQKILDAIPDMLLVNSLLYSLQEHREQLQRLNELRTAYRIKENTLQQAIAKEHAAEKTVRDQQHLLDTLWAELKICPFCDQPIMKGAKQHGC